MNDDDFVFSETINYRDVTLSDLLSQIVSELVSKPDSCFSINLRAWYNATYVALSDIEDCSYLVSIEGYQGETEDELLDFIKDYAYETAKDALLVYLTNSFVPLGAVAATRLSAGFARELRTSIRLLTGSDL